MAEHTKAKGTLLKHGTGSGPIVYTTIANRVSIDGPDGSVNEMDVTDLDSDAMEYEPGLPDLGEINLTCNYKSSNTTHQLLMDKFLNPVNEPWALELVDGTVFPFEGFVKKFKFSGVEVNGKVQAEVGIKLSGTMTPDYP